MKTSKNMKTLTFSQFFAIDGVESRRYVNCIISSVASVTEREAGSNESASAFSGRAA